LRAFWPAGMVSWGTGFRVYVRSAGQRSAGLVYLGEFSQRLGVGELVVL